MIDDVRVAAGALGLERRNSSKAQEAKRPKRDRLNLKVKAQTQVRCRFAYPFGLPLEKIHAPVNVLRKPRNRGRKGAKTQGARQTSSVAAKNSIVSGEESEKVETNRHHHRLRIPHAGLRPGNDPAVLRGG